MSNISSAMLFEGVFFLVFQEDEKNRKVCASFRRLFQNAREKNKKRQNSSLLKGLFSSSSP